MSTKEQNKMDRTKRLYIITAVFSLLFHLLFLFVVNFDYLLIDFDDESEPMPEEVTIIFPENKPEPAPKRIVENINETEEIPDRSDLLSDRNSRAANPEMNEFRGEQPLSQGNTPFENLTNPNQSASHSQFLPSKKFSKEALRKSNTGEGEERFFKLPDEEQARAQQQAMQDQQSTNNIYDQKTFSADQLGNLTLSTYAWEWAPYINSMKRKLMLVWFAPAAYYRLGLIHGHTDIRFTISREGKLLNYDVLNHTGHESLQQSSVNAITAIFPFKPLPQGFPEETLTITARLIYPNLREGSN